MSPLQTIPKRSIPMFFLLPFVAGCPVAKRPQTIVVIPRSTSTDYSKRMRTGVMDAVNKEQTTVVWRAPQAESDYTQQAAMVRSAVEQHVAGIVLVPDHQLVLAASVRQAKQMGIPVVVVGAPISLSPEDYVAFIGSNDGQIGMLAADRIGHLLNGKGKVGIIGVSPVLEGFNRREDAFAQRLRSQYPEIELVGTEYGLSDWAHSTNAAQDMVTKYPDLNAIFASDSFATMGSIAVLRRNNPRRVRLVGADAEVYILDALRAGDIDGVIATDWRTLGRLSMEAIQASLAHQPFPRHTEIPVEMVTALNIDRPEIRPYLPPLNITPTPASR